MNEFAAAEPARADPGPGRMETRMRSAAIKAWIGTADMTELRLAFAALGFPRPSDLVLDDAGIPLADAARQHLLEAICEILVEDDSHMPPELCYRSRLATESTYADGVLTATLGMALEPITWEPTPWQQTNG